MNLSYVLMNLSYVDEDTRRICYSLVDTISPFRSEDIIEIRAHIADLRAAPSLADAPVNYSFFNEGGLSESAQNLRIEFGRISIICRIISNIHNPEPGEIKRLQILEINLER